MKIKKLTVVLCALLIVYAWGPGDAGALDCSHPTMPVALDALQTSDAVEVSIVEVDSWDGKTPAEADDNIYYVFSPKDSTPDTAFIFLPGGNSDPEAYAPAVHQIAAEGFLIIILPMPECVAMPTGYKRADRVVSDFAEIEKWAIGGHSVGGTAACIYAKQNAFIDGVIIWASIPPVRLTKTDIKVLVVYGSEDGRNVPEYVLKFQPLLPDDTIYKIIEGGNHTQFAYYDTSPVGYLEDDNPATITLEEQHEIAVKHTADFLRDMPDRPQSGGVCLAGKLLGADSTQLDVLRLFRDEVLGKHSMGMKLIAFYYEHEGAIVSILDRYPQARNSARALLESLVPIKLKTLNQ